jgi:hypothetical protein
MCDAGAMTAMFYRTFGSPQTQYLAQSAGDVLPAQHRTIDPVTGSVVVKPVFVNYQPLAAAVAGRATTCGGPEHYRDDMAAGFTPSAAHGIVAAPRRPEDVVGTRGFRDISERGGELLVTRAPMRDARLSGLSLMPQSERAYAREDGKSRINNLLEVYARKRLQAASSGAF